MGWSRFRKDKRESSGNLKVEEAAEEEEKVGINGSDIAVVLERLLALSVLDIVYFL